MKALVELIVAGLVDHPEDVTVREIVDGGTTRIELRVAAGDLGKVIGKQGRTARSIRTVLGVAARKQRQRVVFEIVE
jgi:hypothetical protein